LLHTKLNIIFLLLLFSAASFAQKIDTTQRINTWTLQHNYTRFETTVPDTSLDNFHRIINPMNRNLAVYNTVGIIGNAAQNVNYINRPAIKNFLFGSAYFPYLATPENTVFYNTKVPFTEISYSTMPIVTWKEETASVLHTQNMNPFTNFGFRYDLSAGTAVYDNEDSRSNHFTFFGSHAKDKYSVFGTFHYNDIKLNESGGLADETEFLAATGDKPWTNSMLLSNASSRFKNTRLFITQKYSIDERISSTDSLGNVSWKGRDISVAHQLQLINNMRTFSDIQSQSSLAALYNTLYYPVREVMDSARENILSNVFQLIWGDPYGDKVSARIYAGHEFRKFAYVYPENTTYFFNTDTISESPLVIDSIYRDTVVAGLKKNYYNDLFLGFHFAGPTGKKWDWNLDGKYYMAGYYANDFNLDLSLKRGIGENGLTGIYASYSLEKPNYYIESYSSAFFRWENDFHPVLKAEAEAFLKYDRNGSEIRVQAAQITNMLYWDTLALPRQATDPVYLLSGSLHQNIVAGGFHSSNRILLQWVSDEEVLQLPLVSLFTSDYWEQSFFKGALLAQFGFDLNLTTKYYGNAYMPAIAVFYNQNKSLTGGYPFLDLFVNWKIKRTRFFFSWNNVLSGIVGNNYFTTWNYPQKPRYLRFGLAWTFYN